VQQRLRENPEAVPQLLASGGFTRLSRDDGKSSAATASALVHLGFRRIDGEEMGSEQVVEHVHVRQAPGDVYP
jgi:hypothetical protein